jgi:hypothetical protein
MGIVSNESIEKSVKKIDGMSEDALDKLIETFAIKHEDLLGYVMQAGVEYENDDLNTFSIYYFAVIVEAFNQQGIELNQITDADIDTVQEPFILALDEINQNEDYTPLHELANQPHLMQFMSFEIEAEDEDGESLDEETRTQLFIVSASMISVLNASIIK